MTDNLERFWPDLNSGLNKVSNSTTPKLCPECNQEMDYVEDDPEFGHLGWICNNKECGRV